MGLLTSACSLDAQINNLVKMEATFINGAVIGNQKAQTVESGYVVMASGGSLTDGEVEKTDKGYTVLLSTQIIMLSEQ
jgi:hypothetical protein